jgi:hypothetical protein
MNEAEKAFPNLVYVRNQINKIKDWRKADDASDKLIELLLMALHEHITWPLPSWKAIKSGRAYGLTINRRRQIQRRGQHL